MLLTENCVQGIEELLQLFCEFKTILKFKSYFKKCSIKVRHKGRCEGQSMGWILEADIDGGRFAGNFPRPWYEVMCPQMGGEQAGWGLGPGALALPALILALAPQVYPNLGGKF